MRVFLTGATGNIGSAVAEALLANGHSVIGLARSDQTAAKLIKSSIEPHLGDLYDPDSIIQGARQVDAAIHTAWTQGVDMFQAEQNAVNAILDALEGSGKPFIYTSGMMLYGDTGNHIADENTPLNPPDFISWRVPIEQTVVSAANRNIRSIVIRPSLVFGRGQGFIATQVYFARQNSLARCPGTGKNLWSTVHVDDLANLYVRALENATAGSLFNAATESVPIKTLIEAISWAAGAGGKIVDWPLDAARQVLGSFADALWINLQVSGAKAIQVLGWKPQAASVLQEISKGSYAIYQ